MSGSEWLVEAHGCRPGDLADLARLERMFVELVAALDLHPVREAVWHRFPGSGGVTGFSVLAESHLACHTFPEYGSLCLNVFCCRRRPEWDFAGYFVREFGASSVRVRRVERPYQEADEPESSQLPELRRAGSVSLV
jgi:S-adenosylmethionine decarboxylase